MLSVNSKGKAVVFANGTVSCITQSNQAVKKALAAASHQGHADVTVKDVALVEVGAKSVLQWVVVADEGCEKLAKELVVDSREQARNVVKYDKGNSFKSHIERREYVLVNSKKVS